MDDTTNSPDPLFSLLEDQWTGGCRGKYPTIPSFNYREALNFTRRDDKTLAYEQQTQKQYEGQTGWLVSHRENAFLRMLESSELEIVNAQSGGRIGVLKRTR